MTHLYYVLYLSIGTPGWNLLSEIQPIATRVLPKNRSDPILAHSHSDSEGGHTLETFRWLRTYYYYVRVCFVLLSVTMPSMTLIFTICYPLPV